MDNGTVSPTSNITSVSAGIACCQYRILGYQILVKVLLVHTQLLAFSSATACVGTPFMWIKTHAHTILIKEMICHNKGNMLPSLPPLRIYPQPVMHKKQRNKGGEQSRLKIPYILIEESITT